MRVWRWEGEEGWGGDCSLSNNSRNGLRSLRSVTHNALYQETLSDIGYNLLECLRNYSLEFIHILKTIWGGKAGPVLCTRSWYFLHVPPRTFTLRHKQDVDTWVMGTCSTGQHAKWHTYGCQPERLLVNYSKRLKRHFKGWIAQRKKKSVWTKTNESGVRARRASQHLNHASAAWRVSVSRSLNQASQGDFSSSTSKLLILFFSSFYFKQVYFQ